MYTDAVRLEKVWSTKINESDDKCTKLSMSVPHIAFDDNLIKAFCLELALYAALADNNGKRLKLLKFWKTVASMGSKFSLAGLTRRIFLDKSTDLQNIHDHF